MADDDAKKRKVEEVPGLSASEEEVRRLLTPLAREQLFDILLSVAQRSPVVLKAIRDYGDKDAGTMSTKLFVRDLPWDTTSETLRDVFAPFGEILEAAVVYDRTTGKSRGFGFVTYKTAEAAQAALREPNKTIDGRVTQANLASVGNPMKKAGGFPPPGGRGGGGGGGWTTHDNFGPPAGAYGRGPYGGYAPPPGGRGGGYGGGGGGGYGGPAGGPPQWGGGAAGAYAARPGEYDAYYGAYGGGGGAGGGPPQAYGGGQAPQAPPQPQQPQQQYYDPAQADASGQQYGGQAYGGAAAGQYSDSRYGAAY